MQNIVKSIAFICIVALFIEFGIMAITISERTRLITGFISIITFLVLMIVEDKFVNRYK